MPSSDSEGHPPPRKRSRRTSVNANGGDEGGAAGKKARGRPRVDTQDATAADRRRTQIRLAQRAYRQRKETTISSLQDQNARLQSIIEQMNKSFLQFNGDALKSGVLQLNPSLAQQLKQVTESFVALAKSAAEGSIDIEDGLNEPVANIADDANNVSPLGEPTQDRQTQPVPQAQHVDIGWGYSTTLNKSSQNRTSKSPTHETERVLGQSTYVPPMLNSPFRKQYEDSLVVRSSRTRNPVPVGQSMDQGSSWIDARMDERPSSQQLPFGLVDILSRQQYPDSTPATARSNLGQGPHIFSVNIPTPDVTPPITRLPTPPRLPSISTKTLSPTWTYSHDETTFARRLTRAALETGFHLLSAANQRPAAFNYVFKLSLPYLDLDAIRERFKMLLSRTTEEDLDCWETPFIHLGGAGTHYPRKDAQGNIVTIPNAWTVRRIGPISSKMIRAENSEDPSLTHDLNIDLTGFEGEWFDAHDVQGYLEQEKGCHINPKDSFAEVIIDIDEPSVSTNDDPFSAQAVSFDDSRSRRSLDVQSDTPSLSTGTTSIESASSNGTPTHPTTTTTTMDRLFAQNQPDTAFGLDMGINLSSTFPPTTAAPADFTKFPDIDPSTFFDQPLGLDLAPGFDLVLNNNTSTPLPPMGLENGDVDIGTLGLDLMGGGVEQGKKKRAAWVDVSKLIDEIIKHGVCLGRSPGFRRKDVDMAFRSSLITAL